jgi:hypothetical protein
LSGRFAGTVRYLANNPVKKGLVAESAEYSWSSGSGKFRMDEIPQGLKPLGNATDRHGWPSQLGVKSRALMGSFGWRVGHGCPSQSREGALWMNLPGIQKKTRTI